MKKALVIILIALVVLGILVYMGLYHVFWPIGREDVGNGFSVEYRAIILVRSQSKMALYYRGHEVCSAVSNILDLPYELSPDKHYALYINSEKVNDRYMHRYEVYDIIRDQSIIFPEPLNYPTGNKAVKWGDGNVVITGEDVKIELDLTKKNVKVSSLLVFQAKVLTIDLNGILEVEFTPPTTNRYLTDIRRDLHGVDASQLGNTEKVKMIGISPKGDLTHESLEKIIKPNDKVTLELDRLMGDSDEPVLLAYVYLVNGRLLNEELLRSGAADLHLDEDNVMHNESLKKAYKESRDIKGTR